jgi:hypothetical protein
MSSPSKLLLILFALKATAFPVPPPSQNSAQREVDMLQLEHTLTARV